MKPDSITVGNRYVNGKVSIHLPLPAGWKLTYLRHGAIDASFNPDDGTLTVYVRREMDVTEKILVKMKGKETLEKNLNL